MGWSGVGWGTSTAVVATVIAVDTEFHCYIFIGRGQNHARDHAASV